MSNAEIKIDLADLPNICDSTGTPIKRGEYWFHDADGIGIGYGETECLDDRFYIAFRLVIVDQDSEDQTPYWSEDMGAGGYYFDEQFVEEEIERYTKILRAKFPKLKIENLGWDF